MPGASYGPGYKKMRAYVVFQSSQTKSSWDFFTDPAWRHCWLMVPAYFPEPGLMADVFTQKIEAARWGVDIDVWWADPEDVAQEFYAIGATAIVAVDVIVPPKGLPWLPRGPISCVTLTKAVLGLKAWNLWTPKQLFGYLLRECNGTLLDIEDQNHG